MKITDAPRSSRNKKCTDKTDYTSQTKCLNRFVQSGSRYQCKLHLEMIDDCIPQGVFLVDHNKPNSDLPDALALMCIKVSLTLSYIMIPNMATA